MFSNIFRVKGLREKTKLVNVINNILLGPMKAQNRNKLEVEKQADELLKRVGLFERKYTYPRELSGG